MILNTKMFIFRKWKIIFAITISLLLVSGAIFVKEAPALTLIFQPFGGKIITAKKCTCLAQPWYFWSELIVVSGPVGGRFLYHPILSRLYDYRQIRRSGPWVLGNQLPGVHICMKQKLFSCTPVIGSPAQGLITIVGTSR